MKNLLLSAIVSLAAVTVALSQTPVKNPLTHAVYDSWKELAKPSLSANGEWVTFEVNPQKGDGFLHLQYEQTQSRIGGTL